MKNFLSYLFLIAVVFLAKPSLAQLPKMPNVINDFKVSSETNLVHEAQYFNFNSRSSVGANLLSFGVQNIIAPPYFAYPFSATLFMFDRPVPILRYDWFPSESTFIGEVNRAIKSTLTIAPLSGERGAVANLELQNTSDEVITIPIRWKINEKLGKSSSWEWSPRAALKVSGDVTTRAENNSVSFYNDSTIMMLKCYGADFIYKDSCLQSTLKLSPGKKITVGFSSVIGNNEGNVKKISEMVASNSINAIVSNRNYWDESLTSWTEKLPKLTGVSKELQSFYQKGILTALSCQWQVPEFILNPWYSTSGIDGGALNCYLWDISYVSKLMTLSDAPAVRKSLIAFVRSGIDKHYAINPFDGKGMGPLYSYNYYSYLRLVYNYILYSGDMSILDINVLDKPFLDYLFQFCLSKENLSVPPELVNYGDNHNLLELKVTKAYQFYTPSPNAERVLIYEMLHKLYKWKGLKPPIDLMLRSRELKNVFIKQLWDNDKKWLFSLDEKHQPKTAWSIQIFDVLRTQILDKEQQLGLVSHLNENEFLSAYGVHSLSKRDAGYDPFDEDWGGPGVYAGDAPELINDLIHSGFEEKGVDILKKILWWGEFPYYPQAILASKKGYRQNGRANIIAGLNTTQCIITGLFGVDVEDNQLLINPIKGDFINGASLNGLSIRNQKVDIIINKNGNGFLVKEQNGKVHKLKRGDICMLQLKPLNDKK